MSEGKDKSLGKRIFILKTYYSYNKKETNKINIYKGHIDLL